ncbi:SLATT domain-containing protein [Shewanella sp. Isolate8]|uniref:SLATT domain-containing protein n=1 Tax=Shewanella sp. Isolate8 TaxID=2908529 RepID=UPI001EFC46A2|nr:SLATT domain-containing protein [Shewanella sp. Isolate8]MCG9745985.1 SLATT domain-containing protein [Shewanella sp. Isolate8]
MKEPAKENSKKSAPSIDEALESWLQRCIDARNGHYTRAEKLFDLSQILGYVLIYSTVFVTAFSFFTHNPSTILFWCITKQHVVIFVGCIAAVISGIVSQARFGERAEMHRSSGARYSNLARDIEELRLKQGVGLLQDSELSTHINSIIKEWNNLSEDSLLTPHNPIRKSRNSHVYITLLFIIMFFSVAA